MAHVPSQEQKQAAAQRQIASRIKPGEVRNPYGRPKKIYTAQELMDQQIKRDLKAAAKNDSPEAYRFLLETMRNQDANLQHRLAAATQILDRGWGKPTNQTEISVSVYDRMSEVELIKMITGEELDESVIEGEVVGDESSAESDE